MKTKKETKNRSVAMHSSTVAWLEETFKTVHSGATMILTAAPALYKKTLNELRGTFSREELMLIIDVSNGLILTPGILGEHLPLQVADGIKLDGLDRKREIEGADMQQKLNNLPVFSRAVLEIWAQEFWQQDTHDNIEEWVRQLT